MSDTFERFKALAVQVLAVADPMLRTRLWRFKDDFEKAARH